MLKCIRFATFNIRYGKGIDGKLSLKRVAETLKKINAHVVGLQEVDNFLPRSFFQKQAQRLARYLGTEYAFAPNLRFTRFSGFGNAALSKFPILKTGNLPLPGKLEQRGLQYCLLSLPEAGPLYFFNTHLGLSTEDRSAQARAIAEALPGAGNPVVLAGDFNTPPGAPELKPLLAHLRYAGSEPLLTFPAGKPQHAIDHIFISRHFRVIERKVEKSRASDHLPLVCTLELI